MKDTTLSAIALGKVANPSTPGCISKLSVDKFGIIGSVEVVLICV